MDKTGLTELYNIQTDGWAPMQPRTSALDSPDAASSRGDAGLNDPARQTLADVFDRLGLHMESQRVVVDVFVIDHVEEPTPD